MSSLTVKKSQKITATLINILVLSGLMPYGIKPVSAQTSLACEGVDPNSLRNTAVIQYQNKVDGDEYGLISNLITNSVQPISEANLPLKLVALGVEDQEGNIVNGLGAIALDLTQLFKQQGLQDSAAKTASLKAIQAWSALPPETASAQVAEAVIPAVAKDIKDTANQNAVLKLKDAELLTILGGFGELSLQSLGLSSKQIEVVTQTTLEPESTGSFSAQTQTTTQATATKIDRPEAQKLLLAAQDRYQQELSNLRKGEQTKIEPGSKVKFKFRLDNQQNQPGKIKLPNAEAITESGLEGAGKITKVTYRLVKDGKSKPDQDITEVAKSVSIPADTVLELDIEVEVEATPTKEEASIGIDLNTTCGEIAGQSLDLLPPIKNDDKGELIDPLGHITGCAGETLPDYQGFSVALYDPDPNDPTGSTIRNVTELTETELPDNPNNDIPKGVQPNVQNSNPFFLLNSDRGKYSFLFDRERNQLVKGAIYILVVKPPQNSEYDERRIKLEVGDRQGNIVKYTATSLDGRPIRAKDQTNTIAEEAVIVEDAERVGLDLAVLDLASSICDAQEIQITKTGDRALAEPGDIVLYRLAVRNLSSAPIHNLQITDTLPPGFQFEPTSVHAEKDKVAVAVEVTQSDRTISFTSDLTLASNEIINLIYGAEVTPNALRGSGRNSAIVNATRTDNNFPVQDGPAIHTLRLEPGIIEDAGTLIGRVFVDKNFDGEQQRGEPGIPNAVIYLEDGNRVITDPEGLFSVINVLPGTHTGTLDLTSIEEYRLAPNIRFIERNSTSRLVQLEPGGMVRMNFGVTPTAAGKATKSRRKLPSKLPSNLP
ncbi:MAG: hypothetical protein RLZZ74_1223 [Cyanobacteriota bacterium]